MVDNLEELEEELENILPSGFRIETDTNGEIIIRTGLRQDDDDGSLVEFDGDEDEEEEEDPDFDPDLEPLEEDEDD